MVRRGAPAMTLAVPTLALFSLAALSTSVWAAEALSEAVFLAELPMVLTASRLAQGQMDAPSSITVIDREQIEASGFHDLADLFRLVPGVYVGHKDGWSHNVSFTMADEYSHRLQVLVDGRSVYLPSIGGVRWDTLPLALADIQRIEVVRGSNAATYGANAYTGVINIITSRPADVEGRELRLVGGEDGHREGSFRWAGGGRHKHRVTLGWRHDEGFDALVDETRAPLVTYSGDFDLGPSQALNLQAGFVGGTRSTGALVGASLPHDQDVNSHFQQLDYQHFLANGDELDIKLYHNYLSTQELVPVNPADLGGIVGATYPVDLRAERWHGELELNQILGAGLRVAWGGFVRHDAVRSRHFFNRDDALITRSMGVFGHAEWRLAPAWLVNAGAMWEDHDLVGGHLSPRLTLHWQPNQHHALRAGVSRAFRNPVQFEANADWRVTATLPSGVALTFPPLIRTTGQVEAEEVIEREIGYLGNWPEHGLSVDLRLFQEHMYDLISITGSTSAPPRGISNLDSARLQGWDGQLQWRAGPHSRVVLNHAYVETDSPDSEDRFSDASPPHQTGLHLMHRLPQDVDVSLAYYWTGAFEPIGTGRLPAQRRMDARIARGFKLGGARAQIAFVVQNLLKPYHEFDKNTTSTNLFDRRGYVHFQLDF